MVGIDGGALHARNGDSLIHGKNLHHPCSRAEAAKTRLGSAPPHHSEPMPTVSHRLFQTRRMAACQQDQGVHRAVYTTDDQQRKLARRKPPPPIPTRRQVEVVAQHGRGDWAAVDGAASEGAGEAGGVVGVGVGQEVVPALGRLQGGAGQRGEGSDPQGCSTLALSPNEPYNRRAPYAGLGGEQQRPG